MTSVIGVAGGRGGRVGRVGRGVGVGAQGRAAPPEVEREHDRDQQQAARGHRGGQPQPAPAGDARPPRRPRLPGSRRCRCRPPTARTPATRGRPTRTRCAGGPAGRRLWCEEGPLRRLLERRRGRRLLRARRQPGHLVVLVVEDRYAGLGGQVRGLGRSVARRARGLDRGLDWGLGRRWSAAGPGVAVGVPAPAAGKRVVGPAEGSGSPRQRARRGAARRWPRPPPWRRRPPRSRAAPRGSRGHCADRGGARHRPPPARSAPGRTSCPAAAGRRP